MGNELIERKLAEVERWLLSVCVSQTENLITKMGFKALDVFKTLIANQNGLVTSHLTRPRCRGEECGETRVTVDSTSVTPSPTRMLRSGVYGQCSCLFGCSTIWGGILFSATFGRGGATLKCFVCNFF